MRASPDRRPAGRAPDAKEEGRELIRVMLVDEHPLVRSGFRRILESEPDIQVAAEASDERRACDFADVARIDVTVLGMTMAPLNGAALVTALIALHAEAQILVVTPSEEPHCVRRAFDAGARGYVCMKHALDGDIVRAVRTVASGEAYISPELSGVLIRALQGGTIADADPYERLTKREKQVLQLIAQGLSAKEIAEQLVMSVNTVAVHRANLMNRLGIRKTAGLVVFAVGRGLVRAE